MILLDPVAAVIGSFTNLFGTVDQPDKQYISGIFRLTIIGGQAIVDIYYILQL